MAPLPATDQPDFWLYEELRTIQMLLLAVALRQEGHDQAAVPILEEAQKRVRLTP